MGGWAGRGCGRMTGGRPLPVRRRRAGGPAAAQHASRGISGTWGKEWGGAGRDLGETLARIMIATTAITCLAGRHHTRAHSTHSMAITHTSCTTTRPSHTLAAPQASPPMTFATSKFPAAAIACSLLHGATLYVSQSRVGHGVGRGNQCCRA